MLNKWLNIFPGFTWQKHVAINKINQNVVKNSKTQKTKGPENSSRKKMVVVVDGWHLVSTVEQSLRNEWVARMKRERERENTPYQRLLYFFISYFSFQHMKIQIYLIISKRVAALGIFLLL